MLEIPKTKWKTTQPEKLRKDRGMELIKLKAEINIKERNRNIDRFISNFFEKGGKMQRYISFHRKWI